MNLLLHHKIVLSYIVLVVIIGVSAVTVLNGHIRLNKLENEIAGLHSIHGDINIIHHRITTLATYGESVIIWSKKDYEKYSRFRNTTDSLLVCLKQPCREFIRPGRIDTLRQLLAQKEKHLYNLMNIIQNQARTDSILSVQLSDMLKNAFGVQKIVRKKKGLAGLFGKKETLYIPNKYSALLHLNDTLISSHVYQSNQIESSADSLRLQNKMLNWKLYQLIISLDKQVQYSLMERGEEMFSAYKESSRIFVFVLAITVVLLIGSFLIIRSDFHKEEKIKQQLKQAVHENEDLLDMRNKVILTVSHDIRGPIGNIHNCADLASKTLETQKRESYLDDIRYSCRHILHLVNNLMDAYRINESKDMKKVSPFRLGDFLKRITDEFSRKANVQALMFHSSHLKSDVTLLGDVDKLEQVLSNLLTNAIKFIPSGSIRFQTEYLDGKLHIEICDTGIGMDTETQKRIFEPFERAAPNINSEGFGLGLYLTKGLVKVLGGSLELASSPGNGSTFNLVFPLPETDDMVEACIRESSRLLLLPAKILVVDDDRILLKVTEDILGRRGIQCTVCNTVQEVMTALEDPGYDLVLTDIQMPGMDGFNLLKLLRSSDIGNSKTIPVAAMTAREDGNNSVYTQSGFCGVLHKPFDTKELMSFLSTVVYRAEPFVQTEFDFSSLFENTDERDYMLALVIQESERELEELDVALKTKDFDKVRSLLHRMLPAWEMLGKDAVLRELQCLLRNTYCEEKTVNDCILSVMEWIRKLIEESNKLLYKHEDIGS